MNRRAFLAACAAASAGAAMARRAACAPAPAPVLPALGRRFTSPVRIESVDLLRDGDRWIVRVRAAGGATGHAVPNERIGYLHPILVQRVAPFFTGKDARDIEALVDGVYTHGSNYKLAGLALWNCVGWVEFAVFDLLGRIAGVPVFDLLGGPGRRTVPVYLSSLRRDTTPEQEVEWIGRRLAETGAKAVKIKVGGRMSRNADASPGRTDRLVPLARKTWGDGVALMADANGSYDAEEGIRVGRLLEAHGYRFYEEPCPFEDFEATAKVAQELTMPVAGGEQDTSLEKFAWYVRTRGLDVLQPDVNYNGGFIRTLRVARLAAAAGLEITPHAPQAGFSTAYMLHFIAAVPNAGPFQEFNGAPRKPGEWFSPGPVVKDGALPVPAGPGLGLTIDPDVIARARPVGDRAGS